MFANFMIIAKLVDGRNGFVSFEWPPSAKGWKEKPVQRMVEWLEHYIEVHGCALGVRSTEGEYMLKPFGISTNNTILAKELLKYQCSRDHYHAPCEGKETTRSGHYTKKKGQGPAPKLQESRDSKNGREGKTGKREPQT
jgi:hypothetical protein